MAEQRFLPKVSAPALIVIVCFQVVVLFQFSSQSPSLAGDGRLAMKPGSTGGQCNLFSGEWIRDPLDPSYSNATCSFIPDYQNCLTNGRPDTDYLHWRWKPFGCDPIPRFDPNKFLDLMADKSILFIGESVIHNQMSSLVCLLSQVEEVTLVYHDERWQSHTWYIPRRNITLGLIWSPFLVASNQDQTYVHMHISLDVLDKTWTDQYSSYDYVLFAGGQWFLKEHIIELDGAVIGCHYCSFQDLTRFPADYSYRQALRLAFQFMAASDHKPLVIFRSWVPSHSEGGHCNRTQPLGEGEYAPVNSDLIMRPVELEEFERGLQNGGLRWQLLDAYHLSLLRADAHPGAYRSFHPDLATDPQTDCLHWCLPGLPDTWNSILLDIISNEEQITKPRVS